METLSKISLFPVRVRIVSALHKVIKCPFNTECFKEEKSIWSPKSKGRYKLKGVS